jgi:NAD(P)-dependent dehydrogenase (short-subunit alcohol dehydrogenase family)
MPSVLVTGAGRGIGLAITEHMSRRGWNVYATARSDAALNSLDRLPNVRAIALDITDRSAIAALPDQLPAELNGVVNNAGIIVNGPVEGLSLHDLTQQLDINVISQIAVTQAVLPKIRNVRGGGIHVVGQWSIHHTGHRRIQRIEVRNRVLGRCTPNGVASVAHSRFTHRAWADPYRYVG